MTISSISVAQQTRGGQRNGQKRSARANDEPPGYLGEVLKESQGSLAATVLLVLANRGAIFFGMPRNGNAVLIRAWIGGDQYEDYCASEEECARTLEALRDAAEAAMMR